MALLWITEHYYPSKGGMAHSCDRIVEKLRETGLKIDLVHLAGKCRRRPIQSSQKGFDVCWSLHDNPAHELNLLWNWLEQQQALDTGTANSKSTYSAVVGFGAQYALIAARNFSAWLDCPLYVLVRGNDFDTGVFDLRKSHLIESVYKSSRSVICVSKDKQSKIRALYPSLQVDYVPSGIDSSEWEIGKSHRDKCNQLRKSVDKNRKIIGLFGHLKAKKGLHYFLETLQISGLEDHFHLFIVGDIDNETRSELDELSKSTDNHIEFTLFPTMERFQLLAYYLACDCIAIPSFYDGMPNVMLEASVLGIPTIASNVGGMRDLLIDNQTGWLFTAGNVSALRNVLHKIAQMKRSQMTSIGNRAQELVLQSYTADIETARYLKIFNAR